MLSLRVAHAYDRNRYHPPEVSGKIATAIVEPVERAFKEPSFLEVGSGTGRIGMPIVARGHSFTGVDVDPEMMQLFRAKFAGVSRRTKLVEADVQDLPFENSSFHAVIAVHIWHLIPELERAVSEATRVIKPGGFLFEGWDAPNTISAEREIQDAWCEALKQRGHIVQRGAHTFALEQSRKMLADRGFSSHQAIIANWEVAHTPLEVVEALAEGLFSFARTVPLELRYAAARDIKPWLLTRFKDPETPIKTPWSFNLRTTHLA